jgi:hypothetical protein
MKPCPDRHETIILAAYGELSPAERTDWERHKTTCPGCRDEYEALIRLLARIKESVPVPELSEKRAGSILWAVKQELRKEQEKTPWWKEWVVRPGRLVPALATACIVLITFGWFGLDWVKGPGTSQETVGPIVENQAMVKDLEIIKNIEFLEEMDTVQELVDKLDRKQAI